MNNPGIQIKYTQAKGKATRTRKSLRKRTKIALVGALLLSCGTMQPAVAEVNSATRIVGNSFAFDANENLIAVAPTIGISVIQSTAKYEDEAVTLTLGFARTDTTLASEWTQSPSNANEYYFNGTLAGLSSSTMYNHRAIVQSTKSRSGTIGSLPTGSAVVGNNDGLGADTLYIRKYDSSAPVDNDIVIVWDETDVGSNYFSRCDVEWWLDLTDSATATAVSGWNTKWKDVIDPRTGNTIDMAGSEPTLTLGSPVRGPFYTGVFPTGTLKAKCRIKNEEGLSTTSSVSFTTGSTARTLKTVKASGGDYTSLLAAVNAASDGWRITVEGGHTEDLVGDKLNLSNHVGVLCEWDGVGVKPVITTTDKVWSWSNGHGSAVYGIDGNPNGIATGPYAEITKSDNVAFVNCDFGGDATNYFTDGVKQSVYNSGTVNTNNMFGILIQGCTAGYVKTYPVGTGTTANGGYFTDVGIIGNDFTGYDGTNVSNNESALRDATSFTSWCVLYNELAENSKSALRQTNMDHSLVYGNKIGPDGDVWLGNSGSEYHLALNVRLEANLITRNSGGGSLNQVIDLKQGVIGATICNNVLIIDGAFNALSGADYPGSSTTYYAGYTQHKDILFVHNTVQLTSGAGNADILKLTGRTTATYTSGCIATKNVLLTHAGHSGSDVIVSDGWASTGNEAGEDTLDSNYEAATLSFAKSTPHSGVTYDYWNNLRGVTHAGGASIASDAAISTTTQTRKMGRRSRMRRTELANRNTRKRSR